MDLPPKWRFKLEKLKKSWSENREAETHEYDTSLRMCPNCRALISRSESTCSQCGMPLKSPRSRSGPATPGHVLGVIPIPSSATSALAAACVGLYILTWFMTARAGGGQGTGLFDMGGISQSVLVRMGAKYGWAMIVEHQWWRLVTAMFLHAGLLHIGMNMWCLFDLGPEVESLFSTPKFIVLYLATGVFGYIVSLWWMPNGISIGASGAIMGLVGILIGATFHHGQMGKDYRSMLWRWVLYIAVFGLFFAVDNAAHFGGLALGLLLGYTIPEGEPDSGASEKLWNALAVLSVIIIAGSFALMALQMNAPLR